MHLFESRGILQKRFFLMVLQKALDKAIGFPNGCQIVIERFDDLEGKSLQTAASFLLEKMKDPCAVVLGGIHEGRVFFAVALSSSIVRSDIKAGVLVSGFIVSEFFPDEPFRDLKDLWWKRWWEAESCPSGS